MNTEADKKIKTNNNNSYSDVLAILNDKSRDRSPHTKRFGILMKMIESEFIYAPNIKVTDEKG